jgi:hypothetical protein
LSFRASGEVAMRELEEQFDAGWRAAARRCGGADQASDRRGARHTGGRRERGNGGVNKGAGSERAGWREPGQILLCTLRREGAERVKREGVAVLAGVGARPRPGAEETGKAPEGEAKRRGEKERRITVGKF